SAPSDPLPPNFTGRKELSSIPFEFSFGTCPAEAAPAEAEMKSDATAGCPGVMAMRLRDCYVDLDCGVNACRFGVWHTKESVIEYLSTVRSRRAIDESAEFVICRVGK